MNFEKSIMFCSYSITQHTQQEFSNILGIERASNLGKNLGIPLLKGRVTRDNFAPIIYKINSRLTSWKRKLLNRVVRLCLVKSVLTSLPVYSMQALWLPEFICETVDEKLRNCIWAKAGQNRSWNLVA